MTDIELGLFLDKNSEPWQMRLTRPRDTEEVLPLRISDGDRSKALGDLDALQNLKPGAGSLRKAELLQET